MLNVIWAAMILLAFFSVMLSGTWTDLSAAVGSGAQKAVETAVVLIGGMCFWSGMMHIAEKAGIITALSHWLKPVIARLFPEYTHDVQVREKITLNIAANLFGMGNAATPAGLQALDAMQAKGSGTFPTKGMILFVVMNTAALQIIPSSVVMLRGTYGSLNPYDIMPHIWLVSFGSLLVSILVCKGFERIWDK